MSTDALPELTTIAPTSTPQQVCTVVQDSSGIRDFMIERGEGVIDFALGAALTALFAGTVWKVNKARKNKRIREGHDVRHRAKPTRTTFAKSADGGTRLQITNPGVKTATATPEKNLDRLNAYFANIFDGEYEDQIVQMFLEVYKMGLYKNQKAKNGEREGAKYKNRVVWEVIGQTPTAQKLKASDKKDKNGRTPWQGAVEQMKRDIRNYCSADILPEKMMGLKTESRIENGVQIVKKYGIPIPILEEGASLLEIRMEYENPDFGYDKLPAFEDVLTETPTGEWKHDPNANHMVRYQTKQGIAEWMAHPSDPELSPAALTVWHEYEVGVDPNYNAALNLG